jgi:hypothetical protein
MTDPADGLTAGERTKSAHEQFLAKAAHGAQLELELYKADRLERLERVKKHLASELMAESAVLEAGQSALRYLTLINGAAAVALLTFVGNSVTHPPIDTALLSGMTQAMLAFTIGVALAAAGFALRYFSQAHYGGSLSTDLSTRRMMGDRYRNAAIITGSGGFAAFLLGMGLAYLAFP